MTLIHTTGAPAPSITPFDELYAKVNAALQRGVGCIEPSDATAIHQWIDCQSAETRNNFHILCMRKADGDDLTIAASEYCMAYEDKRL